MNSKGELYGFDRLLTSIHNGRHLAPDAMLDQLASDVAGYVGDAEQHDDLTLVVARAI
jgi:phosphoserine phosphatase RsbU/P